MTYELLPATSIEEMKRIENLAHHWAKKFGTRILGGFNPDAGGFSVSDFADPVHPRPEAVARLLSQLGETKQ
jgi:hypothetical protein